MGSELSVAPDLVQVDASLPTRFGDFRVVAFRALDGSEVGGVVRGEVSGREGVLTRLHSECFTGDLMGSLRCDCRDQLEATLGLLGRADRGVLLYLPQEGRGIGLVNKVRAYRLQEAGLDTVEANAALGFPDDLRRYDLAAAMLRALGVLSVCLLSNNPHKARGLSEAGMPVVGTLPLRLRPNRHNARYLATKRDKSGHLL